MIIREEEILTPKTVARSFYKRVKQNSDAVIALTGEEGIGKSSLAIYIGYWCCKFAGLTFSLKRNELYSPDEKEVFDKLTKLPKYSPIIADEAIKILYKLGWQKQMYINQLYALARKENKITLLCMPKFTDFNIYFRNHRIKTWIHVLSRGQAVIFAKEASPFSKDPWNIDYNQKSIMENTKKKKFTEFDVEEKLYVLKKCKNYVSTLTFPQLPDHIEEQYEYLRDQVKYKGMDSGDKSTPMSVREKKWRERSYAAVQTFIDLGWERIKIAAHMKLSLIDLDSLITEGRKAGIIKPAKKKTKIITMDQLFKYHSSDRLATKGKDQIRIPLETQKNMEIEG